MKRRSIGVQLWGFARTFGSDFNYDYSAFERGLDGLLGMYHWLDLAPLGRNESSLWWRRPDEYDSE